MEKHLISYLSSEKPEILFWEDSDIKNIPIPTEINLVFSEEKYCTGYNTGEMHFKCRNNAINCSQCPTCRYSDISKVYTRLNFSGYEHLMEEIVNRDYSIYLAYFGGSIVKAGVTKKERVQKRLREQGAILWVELMQFNNANDAYNMERLLQENFNLKNAVRSKYKLENLSKVDGNILKKAIDSIKSTDPFQEHLLTNLSINKISYNIPKEFSLSQNVNGQFLDSKGDFLFYKNNEGCFAVNMKSNCGSFFSSNCPI